MPDTCEHCEHWTGRHCEGKGPFRYKLTGTGWTCPAFRAKAQAEGFAAFLVRECPVKGPGRGRRRQLARAMGYIDMEVLHWIQGHSLPGPGLVEALAEFFDVATEKIEAMILADVRARAERTWRRSSNGMKRRRKAAMQE